MRRRLVIRKEKNMVKVKQVMKDGEKFIWNRKFDSISSAEEAIYRDYDIDFDNGSEETEKYQIISCNRTIKTIYTD